ncbi:MAG: N-acetyl-alpha-D-glucosaminyl L-malate synthase BshA [Candidatus Hydrogenedentes bacterium]|nr:N-acetyl-alpha-D-glucosaminyl L-malate synthase BshA [Candidatus Hydrogenedentota bacterium]
MKIGITCQASAGGSGIVATELGIALAERGHEVHFVTSDPPFRLKGFHDNIYSHYVDIVSYPLFRIPPYSLALATKISEIAEEHEIELWHAHYAIPNAAAALFGRAMLAPERRFALVTTLHGTDITLVGSDPSFFRITKFAIEGSCATTAVSNWLSEETQREFQLDAPPRTIYNFIDPRKFNGQSFRRCQLAEGDEKIIMHMSNFRPVKRVTDVVRAFKRIAERVNARLVMVGEGPERMAAVGVAKQLGISEKIRYLGSYEDIQMILPCADLVFQPSEHESFGLVPLEAMACRVPVLATASGGIVEVVEHGVTGYLTEVGDIEAMAACAIDLLTDPDKARAMGERGQERALRLFDRDAIVSQYEALYAEVLRSRRECAAAVGGL